MRIKSFLGQIGRERIVEAIRSAESRSRGEVRVHVSHRRVKDPQAEAASRFEKLGMANTRERNGVLLYIAPRSQRFAIIGDSGIHAKGGDALWPDIAAALGKAFGEGRFTDGIVAAVARVGDALAEHFPRLEGQADADELPNDVSEDR